MSNKHKETPSVNAQQTLNGYPKLLKDIAELRERVTKVEEAIVALSNTPTQSVDAERKAYLKELFANVRGN